MAEVGRPAPDFEPQSDAGDAVRLSDLRGKPVVLDFYPRDDTSATRTAGARRSPA
jgi:peroxiredoxin Q/BCP